MPTRSAGAYHVVESRLRQIKRSVNGSVTNLQALAKTGAIEIEDATLHAELVELTNTLTDLQQRMDAARERSVAIVAGATTRLAAHLTPGVAFTLSTHGGTETRST